MTPKNELPDPPVAPDCDCTDLDSFMLNVERLMGSELVALSSHEVIGVALLLWCRAWKQRPAASLPDDEQVLAAYARLPLRRFRKLREETMRGFVKCSDGRFYHRVLAVEALKAFEKKLSFRARREADAERLRKWRKSQPETPYETPYETLDETRFVREGQERDRKGTGKGETLSTGAPPDDGTHAAFTAFVTAARRHPKWPVPSSLTNTRRKALKARIKEAAGLDGFVAVLAKAEASEFIREKMAAWSLDWLLKPANFEKVRDGNFDNRGASTKPARQPLQI